MLGVGGPKCWYETLFNLEDDDYQYILSYELQEEGLGKTEMASSLCLYTVCVPVPTRVARKK